MVSQPALQYSHTHTHCRCPRNPEVLITRFSSSQKTYLLIALATALIATLGSLYLSEVLHFVPCTLCWYQRILMYPLSLILLIGLLRGDKGVFLYVLPLSVLGMGVSTYHYLLQKTAIFSHSAVCDTGIPCTTVWINLLGFITIPFLALTAFAIISFMGLLFSSEPGVDDDDITG